MQNKTFRLFISSTFSDFNQERRLLQSYVFPEIKKYCRELGKGYTFQPIDLRWGVSNEAQLDQKTLELCIDEVKASKNNPHPNFLIMAGDRYGWIPTPYAIEQKEFEKIREYVKLLESSNSQIEIGYWEHCKENYQEIYGIDAKGKETTPDRITTKLEFLDQWYKLDKNQLPASYILQERKENKYGNYYIYENWGSEENHLRNILQEAVNNIKGFPEEEKAKYFTSATEAEVMDGILNYLKSEDGSIDPQDYENVYGYVRNIQSIQDKEFEEKFRDNDYDKEDSSVQKFKEKLKTYIKRNSDEYKNNLLEEEADLVNLSIDEKNGSLNYSYEAIENEQNSKFVKTMIEYLKRSIDSYSTEEYSTEEIEAYEQDRFKEDKRKLFIGRKKPLKAIKEYIESDNDQPFVIYGRSGLGKSALMAEAIDNTINDKGKEKVFYRFVGSTATLTSSEQLLISILKEFGIEEQRRQIKDENTGEEKPEPIEEFYLRVHDHLKNLPAEKVIFIDAVDQLANEDEFIWLPLKLPSKQKIIISALEDDTYPDDTQYFTALKKKTSNLYKLEKFEESEILIRSILKQYDRSITDNQLAYLQTIYKDINTPLYLTIAAQEIRHWSSEDKTIDVDPHGQELAPTQKGIIAEYIQNLTVLYHHDKELVKRVLSYLYLTDGLSEAELLELLSTDEAFVKKMAPETFHNNVTKELPSVIWARLHTQLKAFIKLEEKDEQETMSLFHREFNDTIAKQEDIQSIHEELIYLMRKLTIKHQEESFYFNRYWKLYIKLKNKLIMLFLKDDKNSMLLHAKSLFKFVNDNFINYPELLRQDLDNSLSHFMSLSHYNTLESEELLSYEQLLSLEKEALKTFKTLFDKDKNTWIKDYVIRLTKTAEAYKYLKQYKKAIEYAELSLKLSREINEKEEDSSYIETNLYLLTYLYTNDDQKKKSIKCIQENMVLHKTKYLTDEIMIKEDFSYSEEFELNKYIKGASDLSNSYISLEMYLDANVLLEEVIFFIEKYDLHENYNYISEIYLDLKNTLKWLYNEINKTGKNDNNVTYYKEKITTLFEIAKGLMISKNLIEGRVEDIIEAMHYCKFNEKTKKMFLEKFNIDVNRLSDKLGAVELIHISKTSSKVIRLTNKAEKFYKDIILLSAMSGNSTNVLNIVEIDNFEFMGISLKNLSNQLSEIIKSLKEKNYLNKDLKTFHKSKSSETKNLWIEQSIREITMTAFYKVKNEEYEDGIFIYSKILPLEEFCFKLNPIEWVDDFSASLNNFAFAYKQIGQLNTSIEIIQKTITFTKELFQNDEKKYKNNYIQLLKSLASLYRNLFREEKSINIQKDIVETYKILAILNEKEFLEKYYKSLNNLSVLYFNDLQLSNAMEYAYEVKKMSEKYGFTNTKEYNDSILIIDESEKIINRPVTSLDDFLKQSLNMINKEQND